MSVFDMTISSDDAYVVPPAEIEGVLQTLWLQTVGEEAEATVVQVRTLNLLIVVPPKFATPEVLQAIDRVTVQHPGRTITMLVKDEPQPPTAQVAIACRIGGDGKQACGEQITITCGDRGAPLPSIAASLVVAGVPTFLWWLGDPPFADPLLESLLETSDRIMVDSRTWAEPLNGLAILVQAISNHPYIGFTDLQWTALTPWRRQTAQCFDLPDAQPSLNLLDRVIVEHGPHDGDRVAALLFVGWLGSRLGWSIHAQQPSNQKQQFVVQAPHGPVAVQLRRSNLSGAIISIGLHAADANFVLTFRSEIGCVKTTIELHASTPIDRIARLNTLTLDQVVSEELDMLDRDPGFEIALRFAAQLTTTITA